MTVPLNKFPPINAPVDVIEGLPSNHRSQQVASNSILEASELHLCVCFANIRWQCIQAATTTTATLNLTK